MNEGIPFVVEGKQIYLPFTGVLLAGEADRTLTPISQISYLTQRISQWHYMKAERHVRNEDCRESLGVTKMSVTRCFDELEYLEMPVLAMKGKSRVISMSGDPKEQWEEIHSILRNPVITTFEITEDLKLDVKGGMSALANILC